MPIKFGKNERIKSPSDTYFVTEVLSQGAFAHAAKATSSKGNVFLKRYFSPTPAIPWYPGFKHHQMELKRRIASNPGIQQYCYGFLDFFEGTEGRSNKTFHQVFEFIDGGKPLTDFISEFRRAGPTDQWDQRVRFARVMMMGIAGLHSQKIVHTDLKPDNLLLIPNPHVRGEYHLKVIDMDWAIFSDQRAPWHGHQGYVGTPMYLSPEHGGKDAPDEKADVFTCALMLGELLGGEHPFASAGDYASAITYGRFKPFRLPQPVPKAPNTPFIESLINRALSPRASDRPTAVELRDCLFGKGKAGDAAGGRPPIPLPPEPVPTKSILKATTVASSSVEFSYQGRPAVTFTIETLVGRGILGKIGPDAQFAADPQYKIHRDASRFWVVSPVAGTPNETLVDGVKLTETTKLRAGMRIAVGNSSKGIEKLPLIVTKA